MIEHPLPTTALSGLLANDGAEMLRAVVHTGRLPAEAPPQLAPFVEPVRDDRGRLWEWRLRSDVPAANRTDAAQAFRQWRSGFTDEWFLGERALIAAVLAWARGRCDLSAVEVLRLPLAHVSAHTALQMRRQVDAVRAELQAGDERGFGIFTAAGAHGASRVLIPSDPPTVLLAADGCSLSVDDAGLHLRIGDPAVPSCIVRGWQSTTGGVHVDTDAGPLELGHGAAAELLQITGRHAPQVEVRPAPLATLLAPLLVFLHDAAQEAGDTGNDLYIRGAHP